MAKRCSYLNSKLFLSWKFGNSQIFPNLKSPNLWTDYNWTLDYATSFPFNVLEICTFRYTLYIRGVPPKTVHQGFLFEKLRFKTSTLSSGPLNLVEILLNIWKMATAKLSGVGWSGTPPRKYYFSFCEFCWFFAEARVKFPADSNGSVSFLLVPWGKPENWEKPLKIQKSPIKSNGIIIFSPGS